MIAKENKFKVFKDAKGKWQLAIDGENVTYRKKLYEDGRNKNSIRIITPPGGKTYWRYRGKDGYWHECHEKTFPRRLDIKYWDDTKIYTDTFKERFLGHVFIGSFMIGIGVMHVVGGVESVVYDISEKVIDGYENTVKVAKKTGKNLRQATAILHTALFKVRM